MPKLEAFDPSRPLVAQTMFRFHGDIYRKGDAVPYASADRRVLERLYTLRRIGYGEGGPVDRRTPDELFKTGATQARAQERGSKRKAAEKKLVDKAAAGEAELAEAKKLANKHTHDQLFKMAAGLAGVTKSQKKDEIALALVRAGRGAS